MKKYTIEEKKDLLEAIDYYIWAHDRSRTEWLEPADCIISIDLSEYAILRDELINDLDPELWNLRSKYMQVFKKDLPLPSESDENKKYSMHEKDILKESMLWYLESLDRNRRILTDREEIETTMQEVHKILEKLEKVMPF